MKIDNYNLSELTDIELSGTNGGLVAIKWSWTSFWRGVGIGAAGGAAGAATLYA